MARIRTIKPEFPQSESIGTLSRDARLLFIQLWTLADDAGRARAAARMLASLLYPYDDDAPALIESWLRELEKVECIRRYEVDGTRYLEICNWQKHQKIDRPSASKLPAHPEASRADIEPARQHIEASRDSIEPAARPRAVALPARERSSNPRESSRALAADLGPGTKDQGPGYSEAHASGVAQAPPLDPRMKLFREGLETVQMLTGKPADKCRTFLGRLLKDLDDDCVTAMRILEDARTTNPADPVSWIAGAVARRRKPAPARSGEKSLAYIGKSLGLIPEMAL